MNKTTRAVNFKQEIEQVIKGYETDPAKGLVHGCAKDWIQNGWGHRTHRKTGKEWSFVINHVTNKHGDFLVVEDNGATGLVGKNYTQDDLAKMMDDGKKLDETEKLARFCSLYNSGGNSGLGLFGRGKLMYQAASETLSYYFDSFTIEGNYVANMLEGNDILVRCYEGEEAKAFIKKETGLDEKKLSGTRIIIVKPKKEVVAQLKDGRMIAGINETWWKIIQKYNVKISIQENGVTLFEASVPDVYSKYYTDNKKSYIFENVPYRDLTVKKIGFILVDKDDELGEDLENIAYYRNNMKIGNVYQDIDALPIDDEYKHRISGFIEVDDEWETLLTKNESLEHYGSVNKKCREIQGLKSVLNAKLEDFAVLVGIKKKDSPKKPNEELEKLANDFTDFLLDNNVKLDWEPSKNNKNEKPIELNLHKVYPNEGKRTLEYNQEISFQYSITNNTKYSDIKVEICIIDADKNKQIIKTENIEVEETFTSDSIVLNYNQFKKGQRSIVYVRALINEDNKACDYASFPVFVDIDDQKEVEDIEFKLVSIQLPREGNRSVYLNEEINDIKLSIKNNLNTELTLGLSCLVQDVQDRNNTIENFYRKLDIILSPGEEKIIGVDSIKFGAKYIDRKGQLQIRFNLSHISGLEKIRKGEKIGTIGVSILFEEEQIDTTLKLFNVATNPLKDKYMKSRLTGSAIETYTLEFNSNYILYRSVFDAGEESLPYKMFTLEEMCKAIVNIKLENFDYNIINTTAEEYADMTPTEVLIKINGAVDKFLGQYFEMRG